MPASSLKGKLLSSGSVISRSLRTRVLSIVALPFWSTVNKLKGTFLECTYQSHHRLQTDDLPNGLIIVSLSPTSFQKPILTDMDSIRTLGYCEDRKTNLMNKVSIQHSLLFSQATLVIQFSIKLMMSRSSPFLEQKGGVPRTERTCSARDPTP